MEYEIKKVVDNLVIILNGNANNITTSEVEELVEEIIYRSRQGVRVHELIKRVRGQS